MFRHRTLCHRFAVLLFLLLPAWCLRGQDFLSQSELGINVGVMNYIGDLNNQKMFSPPELGHGMALRYKATDRWAFTVGFAYGHVRSNDYLPLRNLSFRSHILEGSARAEFNFIPFSPTYTIFRWTPYMFGGIGFCAFNPMAQYTDPETGVTDWVALQPLGTEGQLSDLYPDRNAYRLSSLTIPFGMGVKLRPWKPVVVTIEYGYRKTFTDYLDDVSLTYPDPEALTTRARALSDRSTDYTFHPGMLRGDNSLKDWYAYLNASVYVDMDLLFGWMRTRKCDPQKK